MTDRTKPKQAVFREGVTWRVYDAIVNRRTIHVDIWLYQMPDDELYFVIREAVAGHVNVCVRTYHVTPYSLVEVANIPRVAEVGLARSTGSKWARKNIPWIKRYHNDLREHARSVQPSFRRRSIWLHYVYTDRRVVDPFEGIENLYSVTDRAARDLKRMSPERQAEIVAHRDSVERWRAGSGAAVSSAWNAAERSQLRTLDKLLKG